MIEENGGIVVTSGLEIAGYQIIKNCGIVRGLVVRVPTITQGILGGLKSIIGGRVESYRQMCEASRIDAYNEMLQHAAAMGANAIIAMRYDSSDLGGTTRANEILCYGTAVVIQKIPV